jgi:hypothetical protein
MTTHITLAELDKIVGDTAEIVLRYGNVGAILSIQSARTGIAATELLSLLRHGRRIPLVENWTYKEHPELLSRSDILRYEAKLKPPPEVAELQTIEDVEGLTHNEIRSRLRRVKIEELVGLAVQLLLQLVGRWWEVPTGEGYREALVRNAVELVTEYAIGLRWLRLACWALMIVCRFFDGRDE